MKAKYNLAVEFNKAIKSYKCATDDAAPLFSYKHQENAKNDLTNPWLIPLDAEDDLKSEIISKDPDHYNVTFGVLKTTLPSAIKTAEKPARIVGPDDIPLVMAFIGDDDPSRGDSHAAVGIAQRVAAKLNGKMLYVDTAALSNESPDGKGLRNQLRSFIEREGMPDIIIGPSSYLVGDIVSPSLTISRWAEDFCVSHKYQLSPHHITMEMLAEEGAKFSDRYQNLPRPLIGIILGVCHGQDRHFMRKLAEICGQYSECTVFFCPSRKTDVLYYEMNLSLFKQLLEGKNMQSRVHVQSVSYRESQSVYNPYIGLIDQADHIIVSRGSMSLISEPFIKGRNIFVSNNERIPKSEQLIADGYIIPFEDCAIDQPLITRDMPSLNPTDEVASGIVSDFYKVQAQLKHERYLSERKAGPLTQKVDFV